MASMQPVDPHSSTVPAYDLRISIRDTEPEIWRRLLVPETVTVFELHHIIQAAFGWEDRHLFGIRCTDRRGSARVIIGPDSAAEEMDDEPASGVVLADLLDPGRTGAADFEYEYDFGDAWTHDVVVMGAAELRRDSSRCSAGANRGPVEDSGGPHGYARLVEALGDPSDGDHDELADWYTFATGEDAKAFEPFAFDVDALNARLEALAKRLWPEPPTGAEIDAVVRPVLWMLEQAGADGLPLTSEGYLKPAVVNQAVHDLGWAYRWPGKANRESQTLPVLTLRKQTQAWKLLRKSKGRLIPTPAGRKLRDGGRPLWDYLADAVARPSEEATAMVTQMVVNWLLEGSTPSWMDLGQIIADTMNAAGFRVGEGSVPPEEARELYREMRWLLDSLQLKVPQRAFLDGAELTDGGRKFLLQVQRVFREG